jgi:hypothetical protein
MNTFKQQSNNEEQSADRRNFLKKAGLTGLGLAGAALTASKIGALDNSPIAKALGMTSDKVQAASVTDIDILNFALNLEYLEAEFYTKVVTGKTISDYGIGTDGIGTKGPTTGGKKINFASLVPSNELGFLTTIVEELMYDEQAHVKLLRSALGSQAIAKPAINLDALGIGYASLGEFLTLARAFEDTGVSAYGGAAPLISSASILGTAARIAETEAMHSGNLRLQVAAFGIKVPALDAKDVLPPPAGTKFFTVDANALAIVRTPSEVLAIVFHNAAAGTRSGGFFPNGVNGNIDQV